jgi:hypothetical protein
MFKAIKDNKIIAINETGDFPCLVFDNVIEDTEHTIGDYEQYNGEFLLKSDIPAPTKEEISQLRATAYLEIDKLHAERDRKTVLGTWSSEEETKYIEKVKTMSAEIAEKYPYPEEPTEEESVRVEVPLMV